MDVFEDDLAERLGAEAASCAVARRVATGAGVVHRCSRRRARVGWAMSLTKAERKQIFLRNVARGRAFEKRIKTEWMEPGGGKDSFEIPTKWKGKSGRVDYESMKPATLFP